MDSVTWLALEKIRRYRWIPGVRLFMKRGAMGAVIVSRRAKKSIHLLRFTLTRPILEPIFLYQVKDGSPWNRGEFLENITNSNVFRGFSQEEFFSIVNIAPRIRGTWPSCPCLNKERRVNYTV